MRRIGHDLRPLVETREVGAAAHPVGGPADDVGVDHPVHEDIEDDLHPQGMSGVHHRLEVLLVAVGEGDVGVVVDVVAGKRLPGHDLDAVEAQPGDPAEVVVAGRASSGYGL